MNKLKKLRLKQGLTQQELGNMLGVNRSTIALWERGTNHLSFTIEIIIAKKNPPFWKSFCQLLTYVMNH